MGSIHIDPAGEDTICLPMPTPNDPGARKCVTWHFPEPLELPPEVVDRFRVAARAADQELRRKGKYLGLPFDDSEITLILKHMGATRIGPSAGAFVRALSKLL